MVVICPSCLSDELEIHRPTTLDICLASHILLLIDTPFPDPLLQTLLAESYPTLTAHARQVHLEALPTTGSDIPILAPQSYSLRALVPWSSTKMRKSKPKSKEDVNFDRIGWGWIALAVFSTAWYIAQSGIIQVVRDLDTEPDAEDEVYEYDGDELE
jgi:sorting and assembly machinery component 37